MISHIFSRASIWLSLVFCLGVDRPSFAAEKLVGLQSAPSMAMALPWIAEEARLYSKYGLDFSWFTSRHRGW
jgi:hypothetical protein